MGMFPVMIPDSPSWAMQIAVRDSVTRSMAALTRES
jgi:hypothetical protein